ncbi:MAG: glycosyltransferase [Candidatus Bathyarchaeum sp.]|nr:MAG: glycosyltransferase [Candidatus Bathyarchaeum sp.]
MNSSKTLQLSLKSISKTIPKEIIGQKIIVDGRSTDNTVEIAKSFGWNVVEAETVGIAFQANQALKMVQTPFFCSFEHDVIVCPNWFTTVYRHIRKDQEVAVVQGVRLPTNRIMKAIREEGLRREKRYVSMDNNLYRTEIIRALGGFDVRFNTGCDIILQSRVIKAGFKWVVDKNLVSQHISCSVRDCLRHRMRMVKLANWRVKVPFIRVLFRFLFSPLRGLEMALKKRCPELFFVYMCWRFVDLWGYAKFGIA